MAVGERRHRGSNALLPSMSRCYVPPLTFGGDVPSGATEAPSPSDQHAIHLLSPLRASHTIHDGFLQSRNGLSVVPREEGGPYRDSTAPYG
jgi:hypothetical protein